MYYINDTVVTNKTDDINKIGETLGITVRNDSLCERVQREAKEKLENLNCGFWRCDCSKISITKTIDDPLVLLDEMEKIRYKVAFSDYEPNLAIKIIESLFAQYSGMIGGRAEWTEKLLEDENSYFYDEVINNGRMILE